MTEMLKQVAKETCPQEYISFIFFVLDNGPFYTERDWFYCHPIDNPIYFVILGTMHGT